MIVTDYKILIATSPDELMAEVREHLRLPQKTKDISATQYPEDHIPEKSGWIVQGGVSFVPDPAPGRANKWTHPRFMQALVFVEV